MKKSAGRPILFRILPLILAVVLCAGAGKTLGLRAVAAPSDYGSQIIYKAGENERPIDFVNNGTKVDLEFSFTDTFRDTEDPGLVAGDVYPASSFQVNGYWGKSTSSRLTITVKGKEDDTVMIGGKEHYVYTFTAFVTNLTYKSSKADTLLQITGIDGVNFQTTYGPTLKTNFPLSYFSRDSSGGSATDEDDNNPFTSDIIIEQVHIRDANDNRFDKVDKDSAAFIIDVIFVDYGLRTVDRDNFDDDEMRVFLTDTGGFLATGGTRGVMTTMPSSDSDAPRFRARFRGMKYNGGTNTIGFRVEYDNVDGWELSGKATAVVHQAIEEEDEDKLAPLTPHMIVSQYSYGEDAIAAGDEFTLDMTIKNTSADIPLENIVMTIVPETIKSDTASSTTGGLTITSTSNTYYVEKLDVGGVFSHSISLRAEPNAAVGSHKVAVTFKFQYVDEINKKRESGEDTEGISIPVTQIDRFSVDELTDYTDTIMLGDEGYITVSFINRGKSTTYNVSGILNGENLLSPGQSVHFGNLEAGKSGTLEFSVQAEQPGEIRGEILVQYEDDNTNQKEITIPYTMYVEEPYYPPIEPPGGMEGPEVEAPTTISAVSIVLCTVGGLAIAVPLMLYIIKRVKAKGSEDFDEVF